MSNAVVRRLSLLLLLLLSILLLLRSTGRVTYGVHKMGIRDTVLPLGPPGTPDLQNIGTRRRAMFEHPWGITGTMPRFRPFETKVQVGQILVNDYADGTTSSSIPIVQLGASLRTRPRTIPRHPHIIDSAGTLVIISTLHTALAGRDDLLRSIVVALVRTREIDEVFDTGSMGIGRGCCCALRLSGRRRHEEDKEEEEWHPQSRSHPHRRSVHFRAISSNSCRRVCVRRVE